MRQRPDIVLLDVSVGLENALAATKRAAATRPQTRTLICGRPTDGNLVQLSMASGAWGLLQESESQEDILEAIRVVTSGRLFLRRSHRRVYTVNAMCPTALAVA